MGVAMDGCYGWLLLSRSLFICTLAIWCCAMPFPLPLHHFAADHSFWFPSAHQHFAPLLCEPIKQPRWQHRRAPRTPNPQAHISNLWRTTTDVSATTEKVRVNLDLNDKWAEFAGPGAFNDPDMLQVGKGKSTTINEHRTNFLMWSIAKSPLLLSTNLTALAETSPALLALLKNDEVIAVNQDELGVQARKLVVDGKPLGKLVGVEACARPDLMALAAATISVPAKSGGVFGSMPEVEAGKQLWSTAAIPGHAGEVLLKHGFYSERCLGLQPPNPIAYNPPYRHPTRPHPRPVWSSGWQAVLLPCDATAVIQRWRFVAPGQYPSEIAAGFARRTLSALVNSAVAVRQLRHHVFF